MPLLRYSPVLISTPLTLTKSHKHEGLGVGWGVRGGSWMQSMQEQSNSHGHTVELRCLPFKYKLG